MEHMEVGDKPGRQADERKAETKLDLFTSHRMGSKCKTMQPINIIPIKIDSDQQKSVWGKLSNLRKIQVVVAGTSRVAPPKMDGVRTMSLRLGVLEPMPWDGPVSMVKKMAPYGIHKNPPFWVNYNNSLTWNKAIWGWFPLLTMIPVRSQWGRYNLPRPLKAVWDP